LLSANGAPGVRLPSAMTSILCVPLSGHITF
jgi:hypothetical protein